LIELATIEEYRLCVNNGFEPLIDKRFELPVDLRITIQRIEFGHSELSKGNVMQGNQRYYRWVWNNRLHRCEECGKPLREYSAVYVSHIITKGSHPEIAHDPRNANILCPKHHDQWETGDREKMRIFEKNTDLIQRLKKEYHESIIKSVS